MSARWLAPALLALSVVASGVATAEPILKPKKYHGPIPQSMLWLRGGFMGGASNEEMIEFLDNRIQDPFIGNIEDFGSALALEAGYARKPHPQFAFRLNASVSFLSSEGSGTFVPQVADPDSLLPVVDYELEFKSELIVLEASGLYFLSDAAVKEFQAYIGGGFSFGMPHESYEETQVDTETGETFQSIEHDEWSFSAGVHALLGAIYYINNTWGVTAEGRLQLMENRYEQIQAINENDELEDVSFVVDYTGFYLTIGVLWGF